MNLFSEKRYTLEKIFFTFVFISFFLTFGNLLHAQTSEFDSDFYYQNSISIQKTGMYILGSWALLNIFSGYYGNQNYSGETKYFFQMNGAWNLVNLGIAGAGLYGVSNAAMGISTSEMFNDMNRFDRILLINTALDVLYIGVGSFMLHRGIILFILPIQKLYSKSQKNLIFR